MLVALNLLWLYGFQILLRLRDGLLLDFLHRVTLVSAVIRLHSRKDPSNVALAVTHWILAPVVQSIRGRSGVSRLKRGDVGDVIDPGTAWCRREQRFVHVIQCVHLAFLLAMNN